MHVVAAFNTFLITEPVTVFKYSVIPKYLKRSTNSIGGLLIEKK